MMNDRFNNPLEAITHARTLGFVNDFRIEGDWLKVNSSDEKFSADEIQIREYHRFEGDTNPDDMSVIYLMETSNGRKGILTDAFGTYASAEVSSFIQKIAFDEK